MNEALVAELEQEAGVTRRVLERVPENRLAWKPHPKSMSLGQLALHVATIPGSLATLLEPDGLDTADVDFVQNPATSPAELLGAFEGGVAKARLPAHARSEARDGAVGGSAAAARSGSDVTSDCSPTLLPSSSGRPRPRWQLRGRRA